MAFKYFIAAFFFSGAILLAPQSLFSQHEGAQRKLSICLQDSSGAGVSLANIKVQDVSTGLITLYKSFGDTSCTSIAIRSNNGSVRLSVSHIGYITIDTILYLKSNDEYVSLTLKARNTALPNALVSAPPVWVRGDTTFFKADAFKDGGERKLQDIITKMPGFEISENGKLTYKKKPVEKITIDGEEVFADKTELLLKSFPLHVLEQVQAIENQNRNKLLKGLQKENLVFVNLALKKDKIKAAFGDGEIGAGTGGRYLVNPVLFSLYGKLKIGYIGDYNSLGTGFDWRMEAEVKKQSLEEAERWMMRGSGLVLVNNFAGSRYIRNRLFDTRVHTGFPISHRLKLKAEMAGISDRQTQKSFYQSSWVSGNRFFLRNDSNQYTGSPRLLNNVINLEWLPDTNAIMNIKVLFDANYGKNYMQTVYRVDSGRAQFLSQQISNHFSSGGLAFDYTRRKYADRAHVISGQWLYQSLSQSGMGASTAYPEIFGLDSMYNHLNQQVVATRQSGFIKFDRYRNKARNSIKYDIVGDWEQVKPANQVLFQDRVTGQDTLFQRLSAEGFYSRLRTVVNGHSALSAAKLKVNIAAAFGGEYLQSGRVGATTGQFFPVGSLDVQMKRDFSGRKNFVVKLVHNQRAPNLLQMTDYLVPVSLSQYARYGGIGLSRSQSEITTLFNHAKAKYSGGVFLSISRQWKGNAVYNVIEDFFQATIDSFNKKAVNSIMLNYNGNILPGSAGIRINFATGYNNHQRQYILADDIYFGRLEMLYGQISISRQWQKKWFTVLQNRYSMFKNQWPEAYGKQPDGWVGNYYLQFQNRWIAGKRLSMLASMEYYYNNLFTENKVDFLLFDAEATYGIRNKPFSFRLRFENITNRPFFYSVNNSALSQSFFHIPLVRQNLIFFVRYEL